MKVSFIMPGRDNLKYAKWSYESIRKNQGKHEVEICFADDFSSDGTWEWCVEMEKEDPNFKWIRNMGPTRVGHTILYDRLIREVATSEICTIWHCDMYLCPGALDAIEKHMYHTIHHDHVVGGFEKVLNDKTIVSLTRIEPPLHPPGPEKITRDFGTEPDTFDEKALLEDLKHHEAYLRDRPTEGIFAPWTMVRGEFLGIGGHDPLFAPQSKEDSDIFNRFQLNGVKFIQTWEGFVYHMTCRGSRFNPTITEVGKNSNEWALQNIISGRNFVRKWGSYVNHDEYMKPIIPPKFPIVVHLEGTVPPEAAGGVCAILEPWCSMLIADVPDKILEDYIAVEQPNTPYPIKDRIQNLETLRVLEEDIPAGIYLLGDVGKVGQEDIGYLQQIQSIVENYIKTESLPYPVEGEFALGNWTVSLNLKQEPDMKALIKDVQPPNWKSKSIYTK